jgi:DNA repair exonuclease SbcCD ATPase subunit
MPMPPEVDDLERLIVGLTQEIARNKASLKTLQTKIDTARQHLERCRYFRGVCAESLKKMRAADLVVLDDFKRMQKLVDDNDDLIIRYQIEVSNRTHEKNVIDQDVPMMESQLEQARQRRAKWGVVIPMPTRP